MNGEVLVKVDNVSKKFCLDLKKSLWYGLQDMSSEVVGLKYEHTLRSDEFWAVKDVSFELRRGECLGLIGHNGAGKTTLLKMLNGLVKPDRGSIEMNGRVGALIALGTGFNPILTGRENIYVNASILGISKREIDKKIGEIIEFAEIGDFIDAPVQSYSSGMQVRLGFAVAVHMKPDILLVDEVLAVGDVGFKIKCYNAINEILEKTAIIFVSHSMPQVGRICTRGVLMNRGQCILNTMKVSEAISNYYEMFDAENSTQLGNKKAKLIDICLSHNPLAENRKTSDSCSCLESVFEISSKRTLYLKLTLSLEPDIKKFILRLILTDVDQKCVAQIIAPQEYYENQKGVSEIFLQIDDLTLNTGMYGMTVECLGGGSHKTGETYLSYRGAVKIKANFGAYIGSSPVFLWAKG